MRIAAIADIHGNLPAFEAVLDHIAGQQVDQIVIAGDIVLGAPDSAACWRMACDLNVSMVRGNTDRYVAHFGTSEADPAWTTEQFSPLQWAVQEFTDEERRAIGAMPLTCRLPDASDLIICHASPRQDKDAISAHTPEDEVHEMMAGALERYVVRGHHHYPQVRLTEDYVIITCGSAGNPDNARTNALYVILESYGEGWRIRHQSVPYDVEVTLRRFQDTGYIEATGPVGRLFMRSVATATGQLSPFFRYYNRWKTEADISLAEAVDRFLMLY